ncbi:hypothetical protein F5Y18DRAFT_400324 [Xylariaceae sp. FL1019]|nr:hypothetical protein F5Y18DRAFT_400324 [Xylariaceae sp. FL1019]
MSTPTSFPQFSRLPPELRVNIWKLACRTGPMRLKVQATTGGAERPVFKITLEWYSHIFHQQKQRMAILHASHEARSEAFRYLDFLSGPYIFIITDSWAGPLNERRLLIDWANDIIQPVFFSNNYQTCLRNMRPFANLTRLALTPFNLLFDLSDLRKGVLDVCAKTIFHAFPRLTSITLDISGRYQNSQCRWMEPDLPPQRPSPETIDKVLLELFPGETIDVEEKELYREKAYHWGFPASASASPVHRFRVEHTHKIRKAILDLRPDVKFDVFTDKP